MILSWNYDKICIYMNNDVEPNKTYVYIWFYWFVSLFGWMPKNKCKLVEKTLLLMWFSRTNHFYFFLFETNNSFVFKENRPIIIGFDNSNRLMSSFLDMTNKTKLWVLLYVSSYNWWWMVMSISIRKKNVQWFHYEII